MRLRRRLSLSCAGAQRGTVLGRSMGLRGGAAWKCA